MVKMDFRIQNILETLLILYVGHFVRFSDGACTIPEPFRGKTWVDSVQGNVSFTTWKMTSWGFTVNGTTVDEWEVADEVKFEEFGYVAYRSLETFTEGGQTYYSYLCLKYEAGESTMDKYKYYMLHDTNDLANGERVLVALTDGLWRYTDICDESYTLDAGVFNLMLTPGKEEETSVECPNAILGVFTSTVQLANGTSPCTGSDVTSDSCTNKNDIQLNLTNCDFPVAYSANGKLSCMTNDKVGDYYYTTVYNHDETVDNENTYRFACLVTDEDGESISISPMRCSPGQKPDEFPLDLSGQPMGMIVTNTPSSLCRNEPNSGDDDSGLETWQIALIAAAGGLLLIIIIIILIYCCCCKRRGG